MHTPGPWWRDDDGFVAAGSGDSYVTIADPNCTKDIDTEANARLIAAAPDLLAALELLASTPEDGDPEPCDPRYTQCWDEEGLRAHLDWSRELARTTIAKAKGGAS